MKVNLDVGSCVDGNGAGERKGWEERESERVYIFGTPALNFQANGIPLHSALPSSVLRSFEITNSDRMVNGVSGKLMHRGGYIILQ